MGNLPRMNPLRCYAATAAEQGAFRRDVAAFEVEDALTETAIYPGVEAVQRRDPCRDRPRGRERPGPERSFDIQNANPMTVSDF